MSDTNQRNAAAAARATAERTQRTVEGAAERARQVGQDAAEAGQTMAGRAGEHVRDLAGEARDRGASLAGEAKERIQREAGARQQQAADRIEDVADALHSSSEQMQDRDAWLAELIERGATELASLAGTLRGNDLRALFGRLQGMAHEQPALFVGASMATGFALMRLGRVATSDAAAEAAERGSGQRRTRTHLRRETDAKPGAREHGAARADTPPPPAAGAPANASGPTAPGGRTP